MQIKLFLSVFCTAWLLWFSYVNSSLNCSSNSCGNYGTCIQPIGLCNCLIDYSGSNCLDLSSNLPLIGPKNVWNTFRPYSGSQSVVLSSQLLVIGGFNRNNNEYVNEIFTSFLLPTTNLSTQSLSFTPLPSGPFSPRKNPLLIYINTLSQLH